MLYDILEPRLSSDQATPSMGIVVTESNLNPIIQVVTWIFLGMTSLMLLFRFITRCFLKSGHRLGWEEALITTAYVCTSGSNRQIYIDVQTARGPATICQLIYMPLLFGENFTLRAFPYYICTQVVLCTSISAACVAYFWPFFRSLRTGLMSGDNRVFRSEYSLSTLTRGNRKILPSSSATNSTRYRDPASYIKITTDHTVSPGSRSQDQDEAYKGKSYIENWEKPQTSFRS
ncbi:hypothetical protein NHQ30_006510 [Ciborinia camelliae]|nr:hypothetical protein NHQ30_006510 [Ciborinia camelliae]